MTTAENDHSLARGLEPVRSNWGWFVALGICFLIAGSFAGSNLIAATLVSIVYIGAMMLVGGVLALLQAFALSGWRSRFLRVLAGAVYALAGLVIIYDPLLASFTLSLAFGLLLFSAGVLRIAFGIEEGYQKGWGWAVAAGVFTVLVGIVALYAWPGISLWLFGAILTVDLVLQGASLIAFGVALKTRA